MESSKKQIVKGQEEKRASPEDQQAKVIEWEDYEQELARLCSLTSALEEAKKKKLLLEEKLHSFIQIEAESLSRSNELDRMREKLESRKLVMGNMSMHSKVVKEKVRKQEEQLSVEIRSLLAGGSSLSMANKRMLESSRSLSGEKGYGRLKSLQKLLRVRQQYMVSQVSLLYPVKVVIWKTPEQELESFSSSIKSGVPDGSKPVDQATLTISGLHLTVIPFTKMSFFTDKKEIQRSSTALGYVAHAVSLIASYLQVPLRYPLRLGGSRTYIRDYTPSIEHSASSTTLDSLISTSTKPVEFPLFIEGQDSTRAAYAVFLLNKDDIITPLCLHCLLFLEVFLSFWVAQKGQQKDVKSGTFIVDEQVIKKPPLGARRGVWRSQRLMHDLEQLLNFIGVKSLGPRHVLANLKELTRTILSPEYIDM
ncbi:uv radiation resistance-associated gene protein [Phtheirospermum japonicum]|uniref:Uv radiation resistance-associated gene protein n=1 Tax=Phtheirospermum japonicum TaxID=374723 RepID=A0A830BF75_9LAMI|nr:uv radiation resistance-associated gene protein [Phtheirospermum japonicum]